MKANLKASSGRVIPLMSDPLREWEFSKHQPVADSIAATLFR